MQLKDISFKVNLFLLGAAKCGTTSLHTYLSEMPEICMSNPKEPFFFECEYEKGKDFYRNKYFDHFNGEKWVGDARHRNLYLPYVPERIYQYNPSAKLLLIVRNPVDRAYSHWWHAYSRNYEKLSFKKAIEEDFKRIESGIKIAGKDEIEAYCSVEDNATYLRTYVDSGFYMEQINRYLKFYKKEDLHIVFTEDLHENPRKVINEIRNFLKLEHIPDDSIAEVRANAYKKPEAGEKMHEVARNLMLHKLLPQKTRSWIYKTYNQLFEKRDGMDDKSRNFLLSVYREQNKQLSEFTGRNLSHWNN